MTTSTSPPGGTRTGEIGVFLSFFSFIPLTPSTYRYLGFSWASGIVTIQGKPYPNGRNQESASEAIAAYEAVALYGESMVRKCLNVLLQV